MKFTTVFSLLAFAAVSVNAVAHSETNASRLARGLPPRAPVRRSRTFGKFIRTIDDWPPLILPLGARHPKPSNQPGGSHGNCNVEKVRCCNSVTHANDKAASTLASLLGIVLDPDVAVGLTCSPLSVVGIGGNSW